MRIVLAIIAIGLAAGSASAQGPRTGLTNPVETPPAELLQSMPARASGAHPAPIPPARDTLPHTKWKTGAIIGFAVGFPPGVVAGEFVGYEQFHNSPWRAIATGALGGVMVGALFALVGGMIGSFFPAH